MSRNYPIHSRVRQRAALDTISRDIEPMFAPARRLIMAETSHSSPLPGGRSFDSEARRQSPGSISGPEGLPADPSPNKVFISTR